MPSVPSGTNGRSGRKRATCSGTIFMKSVTATIGPDESAEQAADERRPAAPGRGAGGCHARWPGPRPAAPCSWWPTTARRRRRSARPARRRPGGPRPAPSPRTAAWPASTGPSGASAHRYRPSMIPCSTPVGHRRHRVVLVVEGQVVEDVLGSLAVHALGAVAGRSSPSRRRRPGRRPGTAARSRPAPGCGRPGAAGPRRAASCGRRWRRAGSPRARASAACQMRSPTRWKPNIE